MTSSVDPSLLSLTLGTRGSALALFQADLTSRLLLAALPALSVEREVIKTTGDRRTDLSLANVAKAEGTFDKGVFIKELEEALDTGTIDVAVHSLKDMPTVLDPRFALGAVLERASVRDVLVSRSPGGIDALPKRAQVGTSSVRRAREIKHLRPDLEVIDLRGNVPTRLGKLAAGAPYDAILLAEAGLTRLELLAEVPPVDGPDRIAGHDSLYAERLDPRVFLPAAGQGAIGLEIRADDAGSKILIELLNHSKTWREIRAEREFLRLLNAGCHTPVGVFTVTEGNLLHMQARVFSETDASPPRSAEATATDPIEAANALFQSLS